MPAEVLIPAPTYIKLAICICGRRDLTYHNHDFLNIVFLDIFGDCVDIASF